MNTSVSHTVATPDVRYAAWYMLFSWFWTTEFIYAMGQLVVAMAVATWYFSKDKAKEIGNSTVWSSIRNSFRWSTCFVLPCTGRFQPLVPSAQLSTLYL